MKTLHFSIMAVIALYILSAHIHAQTSDFETIYNRMYEKYLDKNPSQESINGLMKLLSPEGAFATLNYRATDGSPRKHVQHLISMACAYQHPQNALYHNPALKASYLQALRFWIDTDHQAKNWWYRYIPYPKELSTSVVLMSNEIKEDKALFDKTIRYLRWSYENANPAHMTGANGADIIMGSFAASILTRDEAQMEEFKERMTQLLTLQPSEGIQPDYLFGQHCGHGRQLYFTSYGKEFVNSTLAYLELCKETRFQSPGLKLLQRLFTDGVQWIFYSKQYDPNNAGRFISSDQYSASVKALADRVYQLSGPDVRDRLKQTLQHISGDNSLTGNRMFWRFDYMVHRRNHYLTSSRMTSTRTVGNEAGNGDGEFNYYASNGVNYLFVTGQEYNGDFFKRFNNRQYPGITAEQDDAPLPIPDWGIYGNNGNSFAGGVSDSLYGACGMVLDRRNLQAHKAWFYFDEEFVCLGAGIRNAEGKAEVFTTLNQCNRNGKVQYGIGGKAHTLKSGSIQAAAEWVLHGETVYLNLLPQAEYRIACDEELFSLNANHGLRPQEGAYAYAVCPGISNASALAKYAAELPVKVVANTEKVQAVRHEQLGITEVIFYQPGALSLENGALLAADAPCALLWKEKEREIHLANPHCETQNPEKITLTLTQNGQTQTIPFDMPPGEKAGTSVCKAL